MSLDRIFTFISWDRVGQKLMSVLRFLMSRFAHRPPLITLNHVRNISS